MTLRPESQAAEEEEEDKGGGREIYSELAVKEEEELSTDTSANAHMRREH